LVVRRRKKNKSFQKSDLCRVNLKIKHASSATSLDLVGHQIWRASLYLGDFLLSNSDFFRNKSVLELGAGTGISSLIAGMVVQGGEIIATDYDDTVLELCEANVSENKQQDVVKVRAIDWMDARWETSSSDGFQLRDAADGKFGWTQSEQHELQNVDVIVCADCVYDDDLTDALFRVLEKIMPATAVLYAALEKRFNFCLSAMDEVANGHSNFVSKFAVETNIPHDGRCSRLSPSFVGKVVPSDTFEQHLQYLRTADLELWEIRRR
jgi:predicted nicotinamide N-methyase